MESRRHFLKNASVVAGAMVLPAKQFLAGALSPVAGETAAADYTLQIKAAPIEIAPKRILSPRSARAATWHRIFFRPR